MAKIIPSPREEFKQGWRVLLAAALGTTCSAAAFATASLTFLVPSLDKEMGWGRQDVSTAASIFLLGLMVFAPVAGRLCDRLGARAIALPSIALTVLALVFLSTMTTSLPLFYAGYFFLAIGGAGANFVIYSRVVASRFDAMRGLALGTVIASTGITIALVPFLVVWASDLYGWRAAYVGLALFSGAAVLIVYPWLREAKVPRPDVGSSLQGMTFPEVRKTRRFWAMAVALLLMSPVITGAHFHFIPLYSEKGLSREGGQVAMAFFGVTMVFARPLIGFLLDKLHALTCSPLAVPI
ncbi:MAG: MFS transporter [Burkholderiales bacterium]|nr:MFS transporter [Burkholderiales bacterium]